MDIGSITRITSLPAIAEVRAPAPVPDATRTDLPREAAVQQPAAPVRAEPDATAKQAVAPTSDNLKRQHTLDIATHKVIYEAIDQRTGQVVYQVPDLRYLKAYADQQKATSADGTEAGGAQLQRVA